MTPDDFAAIQYREHALYKALAKSERVPAFRQTLEALAEAERRDFEFWRVRAQKKEYCVSAAAIRRFRLLRSIFGLTFAAELIETHQRILGDGYRAYRDTLTDERERAAISELIEHEVSRERELMAQIEEEQVAFMSSIVLGINDGIIELTGALTGFSFALARTDLVSLTGFIVGISAALSMAASAYMQARHEEGKNPQKAGLYTGVSYLIVVFILIAPFLLLPSISAALPAMLLSVVTIIAGVSFYTSVIFKRKFRAQFFEMLIFSLGVAALAFAIGFFFRRLSGIEV